jgi:hypothetical protein
MIIFSTKSKLIFFFSVFLIFAIGIFIIFYQVDTEKIPGVYPEATSYGVTMVNSDPEDRTVDIEEYIAKNYKNYSVKASYGFDFVFGIVSLTNNPTTGVPYWWVARWDYERNTPQMIADEMMAPVLCSDLERFMVPKESRFTNIGYTCYDKDLKTLRYYPTGEVVDETDLAKDDSTNDVSTWLTYRNEEFRFEFKYPEGWEYEEKTSINYETSQLYGMVRFFNETEYDALSVSIKSKLNNQYFPFIGFESLDNFQAWHDSSHFGNQVKTSRMATIGNNSVIVTEEYDGIDSIGMYTYFNVRGAIVMIRSADEPAKKEIVQKILSSIKMVK